jgi:hypothetical protein
LCNGLMLLLDLCSGEKYIEPGVGLETPTINLKHVVNILPSPNQGVCYVPPQDGTSE